MRYVRLYLLAVYRSWVAFLSGIGSIFLMLLGLAVPAPAWLIQLTAAFCVVVAMFTVWLNELLGREKAERQLGDESGKRKLRLRIAALIHQGRQLQAIDIIHEGNAREVAAAFKAWQREVREILAANVEAESKPLDLPGLTMLGPNGLGNAVEHDVELLQAIDRAL